MSELLSIARGLPDDVLDRMIANHTVESDSWPAQIALVLVLEVERRQNNRQLEALDET